MPSLNVGSGAIQTPVNTWYSLDAMAWPVNCRADVRNLPFRDNTFDGIHCSHLIEHIPIDEVPDALREIHRVLRKTGVMFISAPDSRRAKEAGSTYWAKVSHWGGATAGWEHRWDCTIPRLRKVLEEVGFVATWAASIPPGWPQNTHGWPVDFEVRFLCRRSDCAWPTSFPTGYMTIT